MTRLLVTGGAGFIGSHVTEHALRVGFEVAVLDNLSTGKHKNIPNGIHLFEVDLRDRDLVLATIDDFRPDLVSHQAAQVSVPASFKDPHLDAEVNIIGSINLLDACTAPENTVQHFVFASTGGAIYGEVPDGQRAGEVFQTKPRSPYGVSKLALENLIDVYREHRGLKATVLRYSNVYGPRQDPRGESGVVATFFDRALDGKDLTIHAMLEPGDGGCARDYVYVGDVVHANIAALTGKVPHRVMNVCTGVPTTTSQLAQRVISFVDTRSRIINGPARAGDVERSLLDPARFEEILGPVTPLRQGLSQTAEWHKVNRLPGIF